MKFFLENRVRAGMILAVIILITPIFGTWRSVAVQAGRVEKEFTKKDQFGETVSATLSDLAYHSTLFADLYEQTLEKDDSCAALRRAAAEIETRGAHPTKLGCEYTIIERNTETLFNRLLTSGKYKDDVRAAHMAVCSDISILQKYDDYNDAAKKYNKLTDLFPASFFAKKQAIVFD